MAYTKTVRAAWLGWLMVAAACTTPNPGYSIDGAGPADHGPSADAERRDTVVRADLGTPADLRPTPDSLPWQCQKDVDCADSLSCTVDTCSLKKTCQHALKPGSCLIGGACYADGNVNPADNCRACLVAQSTSSWSPRPEGAPCTADALSCTKDVCSGGKCAHPLEADACLINSHCFAAGATNPTNPCEACDPSSASTTWTSSPMMVCFQDQDDDGVGGSVTQTSCSCAPGWSSKGGDCDDSDANVFPGQTSYFAAPHKTPLGDSWDYNCNLIPEPKYLSIGYCYKPATGPGCKWQAGWSLNGGLEPPTCGVTKAWVSACTMSSGNCVATTSNLTQVCR